MRLTAVFSENFENRLAGLAIGDEFEITARARIVGAEEALVDISSTGSPDVEVAWQAGWRFVLDEAGRRELEAARVASDERTRFALSKVRRIVQGDLEVKLLLSHPRIVQ